MNRSLLALLTCPLLGAGTPALPLPDAPIRIVIPDPAAFDAALKGGYRDFLSGQSNESDPVVSAWRKTQVGSKLEDQWSRLSKDLPWTWDEIRSLHPSAVGISLLQVGHLEAVLVIATPLAQLPLALPKGTPKSYGGVSYSMVAPGAADASKDPDRRMGLAWALTGGQLILATSERALKLTLDELQAGRSFKAPMAGLISMDLDLDALRKDRYFKREFLFVQGPEEGHLHTALRQEGANLVEVREGTHDSRPGVFTFTVGSYATAGWESEGSTFWAAFRRGLLEPIPSPAELPAHALAPLPAVGANGVEDHYAMDFTHPMPKAGSAVLEAGDLAPWKTLLDRHPIGSWGFWVTADGVRRMAIPWPANSDGEFIEACRVTTERRAGKAVVVAIAGTQEIQVGPGLPALAFKRMGSILWIAPSSKDLQSLPTPTQDGDLIRWAEVDLQAVKNEAPRWEKVEGPAQPEQVRPLSDRVLGLLGWMPETTSLRLERHRTANGWTEKVIFGSNHP